MGVFEQRDGVIAPSRDGSESTDSRSLPVATAQGLLQERLAAASHRPAPPLEKLKSVLEAVKDVWAGTRVETAEIVMSLQVGHDAMWKLASADWPAWEDLADQLWLRETLVLFTHIMVQGMQQPFWSAQRRALIGASAFWMLDLCALLPWLTCAYLRVDLAKALLSGTDPLFRAVDVRESREKLAEPNWVWWMAAAQRGDPAALQALSEVLSRWPVTSSLQAEAAREVVPALVCKDPVALVRALSGSAALRLKAGVNAIHLCADRSPVTALESARDFLGQRLTEGGLPADLSDLTTLRTLLNSNALDVRRGILGGAPRVTYLLWIAESLVSDLLEPVGGGSDHYRVECSFDRVAECTGAGKAIGLAVRYRQPLGMLRLAPGLVRLLHPRMRARMTPAETTTVIAALGIADGVTEGFSLSILMLSHSIDAGLGPGGFALISDAAWLRFFAD